MRSSLKAFLNLEKGQIIRGTLCPTKRGLTVAAKKKMSGQRVISWRQEHTVCCFCIK